MKKKKNLTSEGDGYAEQEGDAMRGGGGGGEGAIDRYIMCPQLLGQPVQLVRIEHPCGTFSGANVHGKMRWAVYGSVEVHRQRGRSLVRTLWGI
eukprot:CAMPEP_0206456970 /NCGR_PEP_ID=MMETSP0324_2-20121206/22681_1 /ASSEMBLY_ACC=CAM_ASM_000836 /TAXON_ID=2866 /ORGANISM="Crypthecodinium cohnii, Strain Seligo" /LENGTH=93 /DNA_ID=CAMNT_0053927999 /DNA_START=136 /DNA_END=418 /DNA_ORIENTATION=+